MPSLNVMLLPFIWNMDTSQLICDGVDVLKIPRNHQRWSLVLVKLTAEGEKQDLPYFHNMI